MDIRTRRRRSKFAFRLASWVSIISFLALCGIIGFQMHVRWSVNQDFTLLGGAELEVLTASVFALIATLAVLYRPRNQDAEEVIVSEIAES